MGLNKWKESARQAYRDQQLQDNEGGCGEPVGFVTGFIEACKQRQSEIEKLEKELQDTREYLGKAIAMMSMHDSIFNNEIKKLQAELQATREQLEKAEKVINELIEAMPHYVDCSLIDDENADCDCWKESDIKVARQYFKQKDEVKQ